MRNLAWMLAMLVAVSGTPSEGAVCNRVELQEPTPSWTFNGVWDPTGRFLSLADITGARVLQYRRDGSLARIIAKPGLGKLEFNHPISLQLFDNRYLLKDSNSWLWFDAEFEPAHGFGQQEMTSTFSPGEETPLNVNVRDVSVVDGKGIGYGIVIFQDGKRVFGLMSLDLETGRVEVLREEEPELEQWKLDRLTAPGQAEVAGGVYEIRWGEPTRLRRIFPGGPVDLSAFPSDYRAFPALPAPGGPESSKVEFGALREAKVATGLYARGELLYLLTRTPDGADTRWDLHRIDPSADRLLGSVRLPTKAAHAFLVPGPVAWALVEKAPVLVGGQQKVVGVVMIPSALIESTPEGKEGPAELDCG